MRAVADKIFERIWYQGSPISWLLIPVSWIYALLAAISRRRGYARRVALRVPIVVVGNVTVGGTGKTPVVVYLAAELCRLGWNPGIVTRGYGGSATDEPRRVSRDDFASKAGDEAVLLARRTKCPVIACADRVRAIQALLDTDSVDVIISDDGLQHYAMQPDYEIVVIDGVRGLGNGRLLPAGPLRESAKRLSLVDTLLVNGSGWSRPGALRFNLQCRNVVQLSNGERRSLAAFSGKPVRAHAAIGHPERFFRMLRAEGCIVEEHAWPDHAPIPAQLLEPRDAVPVLITEKDAVKLVQPVSAGVWSVNVDVEMNAADAQALLHRVAERIDRDATSG